MSSVQEMIQHASARHAQLLSGLHETDSAPSQLSQQTSYISDLNAQLASTEQKVSSLKASTASELAEHEKYRDSTFRRFAHKASGRKERFAEKAAKEEREYFDAVQAQKAGEDNLAYMQQLKAEAETARDGFDREAKRHEELQRELDALYESIFAGHTPGFPDEDARERAAGAADRDVQGAHQKLERERHVLFLLRQTATKLTEARRHLNDAHSASQMDMFGGGTLSSMQKRNYLERAESALQQVRLLQEQLRHAAPESGVHELGPMNIASGSIWGDVVFDNIFSDMDMHDKIKNSETQIDRAGHKCGDLVRQAEGREREVLAELEGKRQELEKRRGELQKAREEAFARVMGGEPISAGHGNNNAGAAGMDGYDPNEAPPAYSA